MNKREKMSQERDQQNLSSGEEFHELDETGNKTHELGMMITMALLQVIQQLTNKLFLYI